MARLSAGGIPSKRAGCPSRPGRNSRVTKRRMSRRQRRQARCSKCDGSSEETPCAAGTGRRRGGGDSRSPRSPGAGDRAPGLDSRRPCEGRRCKRRDGDVRHGRTPRLAEDAATNRQSPAGRSSIGGRRLVAALRVALGRQHSHHRVVGVRDGEVGIDRVDHPQATVAENLRQLHGVHPRGAGPPWRSCAGVGAGERGG